MIKIFYGDERGKIGDAVVKELGEGYEVVEGEKMVKGDLENIFFGMSLFGGGNPGGSGVGVGEGTRRIVIRGLGENKEAFSEFSEGVERFLESEARVVIVETKVDKRTAAVKKIMKAGVEIREFKVQGEGDTRAVFGIFDLAMRDGAAAVREVEKIEAEQDAFMFFGLLVTQALKKIEWRPKGEKERRILRELSETDMKMKSTAVEPWMLVKIFLVRLSSL